MHRRVAFALVRTPPLRPTFRLPSLPRPSRRGAVVVAAALALLVVLYAAARETSLFAVRSVAVAGAPPAVEAEVREALAGADGRSLVALDPDELERRLERVPTVRHASVDRAFPDRLDVEVVPERAVAVYRDGPRAWLLGGDGRILAAIAPPELPRLPRVRLDEPVRPAVGATLAVPDAQVALRVLRALPRRFPARIVYAEAADEGVVLTIEPELEIRLAEPVELRRKLASAAAVLRSLPEEERAALTYLDATMPDRIVGGAESEPES